MHLVDRHDRPRRGRTLAVIGGLALLGIAVAWWPGTSGWGTSPHRSPLAGIHIAWPVSGESAIAVNGNRFSRPATLRIPIASVAKVMTAYIVLSHDPIGADSDGFTLTLNDADAQTSAADSAEGQSFVPVQGGEELTEREALEALLLPSANNIAMALADHVAGSVPAFVELMNAEAATLHMRHTSYTDPSGLADTTVSTARDQLRLARVAFRNPTFASIVSLRSTTIPVAGTIANTDTLLGRDGFVGGKTGSDSAAGGCFMFKAVRVVRGRQVSIIGVVLGQHSDPLIDAGLTAADDLVNSVTHRLTAARTVA